jgi:hypothetical protein
MHFSAAAGILITGVLKPSLRQAGEARRFIKNADLPAYAAAGKGTKKTKKAATDTLVLRATLIKLTLISVTLLCSFSFHCETTGKGSTDLCNQSLRSL